jgi:hypothetical protein
VKVWRKRFVKRRVEGSSRDFAAVTVLWNTTGGRANSDACPPADEWTNSGCPREATKYLTRRESAAREPSDGIGDQPDVDDRTANAVFLALHAESLADRTGRSMWRFGVRAVGVWVVAVGSLILVPSAAPVAADPVDMAPKYLSKQTRDGWNLSISLEAERINSVPNLAAANTSREGFVTLSATATAVGGESPSPTVFSSPVISWAARPMCPVAWAWAARGRVVAMPGSVLQ